MAKSFHVVASMNVQIKPNHFRGITYPYYNFDTLEDAEKEFENLSKAYIEMLNGKGKYNTLSFPTGILKKRFVYIVDDTHYHLCLFVHEED